MEEGGWEGEGGEARMKKKTEESLSERGEREGGEICISIAAVAPGVESPRPQPTQRRPFPPSSIHSAFSQPEGNELPTSDSAH